MKKVSFQIAGNLLRKNFSDDLIREITGLDAERLAKLKVALKEEEETIAN